MILFVDPVPLIPYCLCSCKTKNDEERWMMIKKTNPKSNGILILFFVVVVFNIKIEGYQQLQH